MEKDDHYFAIHELSKWHLKLFIFTSAMSLLMVNTRGSASLGAKGAKPHLILL
jgi:hypothetical protein